ncbi:hypothetical protein WN943_028866 [Citrus x changshan-huyou]
MDSEEAECSRDHETVKRQANEFDHDREVKQEALFEVMKNDEGVSAEEAKTNVDNKVNDKRAACHQNCKLIFVFRS